MLYVFSKHICALCSYLHLKSSEGVRFEGEVEIGIAIGIEVEIGVDVEVDVVTDFFLVKALFFQGQMPSENIYIF